MVWDMLKSRIIKPATKAGRWCLSPGRNIVLTALLGLDMSLIIRTSIAMSNDLTRLSLPWLRFANLYLGRLSLW